MNGQLFPQKTNMASVDIEVEHKWLHSSHLRFDTESLICTSQEQALDTNVKKEKFGSRVVQVCTVYVISKRKQIFTWLVGVRCYVERNIFIYITLFCHISTLDNTTG